MKIDWYTRQGLKTRLAHVVGRHAYYDVLRNGKPAKICLCGRYEDETTWRAQ